MQRSLLALPLMMALLLAQALARPSEDDGSERARLRQLQHELEARHAERLAECAKRFEVNKCRNKALAEHRASLEPLLERERSLDEEARTNRARLQSLRTSARQAGEAASAAAPAARSLARAASQVSTDRPANRDSAAQAARRAAQLQKDEGEAAERARKSRQRQAALDAHAKTVQERNALRTGKPASGLPVPSAASIAALPSAVAASR